MVAVEAMYQAIGKQRGVAVHSGQSKTGVDLVRQLSPGTSRIGDRGLITRRSQVQIPPRHHGKAQVRDLGLRRCRERVTVDVADRVPSSSFLTGQPVEGVVGDDVIAGLALRHSPRSHPRATRLPSEITPLTRIAEAGDPAEWSPTSRC